jgi:hypothetical protein
MPTGKRGREGIDVAAWRSKVMDYPPAAIKGHFDVEDFQWQTKFAGQPATVLEHRLAELAHSAGRLFILGAGPPEQLSDGHMF